MCMYERDLRLLSIVCLFALVQACFVIVTPEGRAGLAGITPRAFAKALARALVLYTLPAAGLIKLFHDWVGSDGKSVCMGKLVYLLGCFLLCAALELQSLASKLVETDPHDLDLSTRYPVRWWGLVFLFAAVSVALWHLVSFK